MKKAVSTLFVVLCLSSTLSLMGWRMSVHGNPDVIHVGTVTGFSTIQEAINSADSGATILVHNGMYYEQVVINKSVSLIGENIDSTIINCGSQAGNVILITADNVSVRSFTIIASGRGPQDNGIGIKDSSGSYITYNKIMYNNGGVGLYSSNYNTVSNNIISQNTYGISYGVGLYNSKNNVISGNVISINHDGITLYSSSNNVISGNTISNNSYGMSFTFSSNNIIFCNNFHNTPSQVSVDFPNTWNYGDEGNYWSDYNGTDVYSGPLQNETGSDGIGDYTYNISENNQDNRPLMGMFSSFDVTFERETHTPTIISNSTVSDFEFGVGAETGNKMICFTATGEDGTVGFCRIKIPVKLMNYPFVVLVGIEGVVPTLLNVSNGTYTYLYFVYTHSSQTVTIISSKTMYLYDELLDDYVKLQNDLYDLNAIYYALLNNYNVLLGNYSQLQESYDELNNSYQEHLLDYSEQMQNVQNLTYILAATTAIFIITTTYLSKRAHASTRTKTKVFEEGK